MKIQCVCVRACACKITFSDKSFHRVLSFDLYIRTWFLHGMNDTFISSGFINHSDVSSLRDEDDIFGREPFLASHEIQRHWSPISNGDDFFASSRLR